MLQITTRYSSILNIATVKRIEKMSKKSTMKEMYDNEN